MVGLVRGEKRCLGCVIIIAGSDKEVGEAFLAWLRETNPLDTQD